MHSLVLPDSSFIIVMSGHALILEFYSLIYLLTLITLVHTVQQTSSSLHRDLFVI